MAAAPRDLSDLYLAPVLLAVDARIEELAQLSPEEFIVAVEVVGDSPIFYQTLREEALITAIQPRGDHHGWTYGWDRRGLRLTHEAHSIVLGVPASFRQYLAAPHAITRA